VLCGTLWCEVAYKKYLQQRHMLNKLASLTKVFFSTWPNRIFALVVLLFVAEASYLAVMNSYPMVYDESYHFGLIQFYSQQLNPFVSTQDPSTYGLGNIVGNPSWLYHYLLSFPDRLLRLTGNLRVEITALRFINVLLAAGSLVVFYRITRQFSLPAWIGVALVALLSLTPLFTVLSAQMNYDNLIILITMGCISVLLSLFQQAKAGTLSLVSFMAMASLVAFGSLVKFSFLPLALTFTLLTIGLVGFVAFRSRARLFTDIRQQWSGANKILVGALFTATLMLSVLSIGFYAQSMAKYSSPVPDCAVVLSEKACSNYAPWSRNNTLEANKAAGIVPTEIGALNIKGYVRHWLTVMSMQLYGNITPTQSFVLADTKLVLVIVVTVIAAGFLTLLSAVGLIKQHPQLALLAFVAAIYLGTLFLRNYTEYLRFGYPVAIQGRYFLPVLAIVYLTIGLGAYHWFSQHRHRSFRYVQFGVAAVVMGSLLLFGGGVSYAAKVLPGYEWHNVESTRALTSIDHLATVLPETAKK
jgi:hypothetical protein